MTALTPDYTLYYWPVPFRGHFIRAILTYAGASWEEGQDGGQIRAAEPTAEPVPFMGLPFLIDHTVKAVGLAETGSRSVDSAEAVSSTTAGSTGTDGFALSQMPAIAYYLGEKLGLLPDSLPGRAETLKVVGDANDVIDELTVQGGLLMWAEDPAAEPTFQGYPTTSWPEFVPRLERWMRIFETVAVRHGLGRSEGTLLGTPEPTVADIVTATLWMTMLERLPALKPLLERNAPRVLALSQRLWALPVLAQFSQDSFDRYGDAYCGGIIEQSLRRVTGER